MGYSGVMAYGSSKLLVMMWARELATHLDGTGVDVNVVHPGEAVDQLLEYVCIFRFKLPGD